MCQKSSKLKNNNACKILLKPNKGVGSIKDRVGGKIVFEILGVWTRLLENLE